MKNPYQTLGVDNKASSADIKKAYRKKAKSLHPDISKDEEAFKELGEAYAVLANPVAREKFDETGRIEKQKSFESQVAHEIQVLSLLIFQKGDWSKADFVAEMKRHIVGQLESDLQKKRRHEMHILKLQDAIKRVKRKDGGTNFIASAFQSELTATNQGIALCDEKIKLMGAMMLTLDTFKWEYDIPANGFQYLTMNNAGIFRAEIKTNPT